MANQISDTTTPTTTTTWIAYLNSATASTPKEYKSIVPPDTVGSTAVSTPIATCSSTDHFIAGQRKMKSYQHQQQQQQQQWRSPSPPDNDASIAKSTNYERQQDNDDDDDDHGGSTYYSNAEKNCKRDRVESTQVARILATTVTSRSSTLTDCEKEHPHKPDYIASSSSSSSSSSSTIKGESPNKKAKLVLNKSTSENNKNDNWNEMYKRLVAYEKAESEKKITTRLIAGPKHKKKSYPSDKKLRDWVIAQQMAEKKGQLSEKRIRLLKSINYLWDDDKREVNYGWNKGRWKETYQRLVAYKKKHKTTIVRRPYPLDPKLAVWVNTQRTEKNRDQLSEERIALLNSIGFVWDVQIRLGWDEMYRRLCIYKEKNNQSTMVPVEAMCTMGDSKLGDWVGNQRYFYRKGKMEQHRVELLNDVDFVWDIKEVFWMEKYKKLVLYAKNNNNSVMVPRNYKKDPKLGSWVHNQRSAYKTGKITERHMELLNRMGFVWVAGKNSYIVI